MNKAEILDAQLTMIMRSARVKRYHTEDTTRTQTVGEHTYGVMWLAYLLSDQKPSMALILAAMMHDSAEHVTGDVPSPIKRKAGVKESFDALEEQVFKRMGIEIPELTKDEQHILKLADCMEGALFCWSEVQRGNVHLKYVLDNYLAHIAEHGATSGIAKDIYYMIRGVKYNEVSK